jgi:lipopolysaccharide transport system permease protein
MTNTEENKVLFRSELVLEAGKADSMYWRDLWYYRELFGVLAWRDVAVRYKQTLIGVAWAVIRPFLTMIVFTVIFGRVAQLPSEGNAPYALMVFAGMLPWFVFATILNEASNSLVANSTLVGKVYFPRIIIPSAAAVVSMVDLMISLVILLFLMIGLSFLPDWRIVFLPVFSLLAVGAALGPALLLCALNVKYRDFRYVIPFIIQIGLYVSPVGFSSSNIPEEWRFLYALNPMVGVIDGFRWCILSGEATLSLQTLTTSLVVISLFLWYGIRVFRRTEKTFADLI